MDTQQIFDDLKQPLGEAAARSLARTFAAVVDELRDTVTREDFRILRDSIDENVARLDRGLATLAEAQGRTEVRVERLAEAQTRTEARVEQLAEAQGRTEARVEQLAEAQGRTEARVEQLAEAQGRTEARVEQLAEAQGRTEARVEQLAEAQTRTEARLEALCGDVSQLAAAQTRTEARLEALCGDVSQLAAAQRVTEQTVAKLVDSQGQMQVAIQRLTIRTDSVVGRTLELQFRDRIASYLGLFMRRCRLVDPAQLLDTLEPHLDQRELADVIRADAIASGLVDGKPSHVIVEVSAAADVDDIERARRRAGLLRRAGLDTVAIVACEVISPESVAFAKQADVLVWLDGRMLESGEAA